MLVAVVGGAARIAEETKIQFAAEREDAPKKILAVLMSILLRNYSIRGKYAVKFSASS